MENVESKPLLTEDGKIQYYWVPYERNLHTIDHYQIKR